MDWESWVINEHEKSIQEANFLYLNRYILATIVFLGIIAWLFVEIAV